ncbi:hypothetical protein AYO45_00680 [Gammaproteobacteria bacterium SCGC AG-212-F23]|nr:hypothetical protein AYO45_00680 [Gammaproteobacteria bacterium SCGC AG-212-F23]
MRISVWFLNIIFFLLCSSNIFAEQTSPLGSALRLNRISQVVPSTTGKQTAFIAYQIQSSANVKKWEYILYLRDSAGRVNLLIRKDKISSLAWSYDEKLIYFLAKGDNNNALWVLDTATHEVSKVLEYKSDILAFKLSPNNKYIAFTAEEQQENTKQDSTLIEKNGEIKNICLYLVEIKRNAAPILLTSNHYSVSQFFVYPGFDWAPNSKAIVFSYQPHPGLAYTFQNKIAVINLENHQLKTISYTENHNSTQPAYSLDGQWIAYQASSTTSEAKNNLIKMGVHSPYPLLLAMTKSNHICISNAKTFETHCLADTFNQDPIMIGWNQSSDHVLVFDPYYKSEGPKIYALNINPAIPPKLIVITEGFIEPLTISLNNAHNFLGFGYETATNAPQAFITNTNLLHMEKISDFKEPSSKPLGQMKSIQWNSFDGKTIEGILITPENYNSKKKYPLLVSVHGGPAAAWSKRYLGGCDEYGEMIDPTTCWNNLLNLGFIIFQPNPRGSDGYGLAFRLANFKDIGNVDYQDIISGVDHLIQSGIVDANHLAIAGWSYGGYLAAWSISQSSQFKAAVDGDGNTDWISYEGTSSQPLFTKSYFGNFFWEDDALYLKRSTILYAKNIQTPLLILHGENDTSQVPITQSIELYTALQQQGKNVKMFILPKQGHVPNDINVIEESVAAIDSWLKKAL